MMRILRLMPGAGAFIEVEPFQMGQSPIMLKEGPIESFQDETLAGLPVGSRLAGHIWTDGPEVVVRYYEALTPEGDRIPICAVVRWPPDGSEKLPGSGPGVAVLKHSRVLMVIVDHFR
jgi:hypothetical protein